MGIRIFMGQTAGRPLLLEVVSKEPDPGSGDGRVQSHGRALSRRGAQAAVPASAVNPKGESGAAATGQKGKDIHSRRRVAVAEGKLNV